MYECANASPLEGLDLKDLRAAVKIFRICQSFHKGQIKDEDCADTLKQALGAKFNCDLPDAINITINDVLEVHHWWWLGLILRMMLGLYVHHQSSIVLLCIA